MTAAIIGSQAHVPYETCERDWEFAPVCDCAEGADQGFYAPPEAGQSDGPPADEGSQGCNKPHRFEWADETVEDYEGGR